MNIFMVFGEQIIQQDTGNSTAEWPLEVWEYNFLKWSWFWLISCYVLLQLATLNIWAPLMVIFPLMLIKWPPNIPNRGYVEPLNWHWWKNVIYLSAVYVIMTLRYGIQQILIVEFECQSKHSFFDHSSWLCSCLDLWIFGKPNIVIIIISI